VSILIVVDLDDILNIEADFKQQILHCFKYKKYWDAVSANRVGEYYDIWALRSEKLTLTVGKK
jgi:hypothetical protein